LDQVPEFPKLRVAISTGEAIAPQLAKRLRDCGKSVWNLYGPTETTVWATASLLDHEPSGTDDAAQISAPIGHPLEGINVLVLDENGTEAQTGTMGELLIGGVCVARGYYRDPDLTRERFVIRDGTQFYRTGDIVTRDDTGCLNYFGRVDDQLSIQGRRVEPREIEVLILRDPQISQAAATWFDTDVGTKAIVAAIVLAPGAEISASVIQESLEQNLPRSMIPAKFIKLRDIPINKNGKVDRDTIRVAAMAVTIEPTEPTEREDVLTSDTEKLIAGLWKRMMHLDDISPTSHFFTIGGDSLAAVSLNLQLEQQIDVSLPAQLVLEAPVLRDFAARVDLIRMQKRSSAETSFIFPLVSRPNTTPVFFCGADLTMARTVIFSSLP
jgi:acyl carrier protein